MDVVRGMLAQIITSDKPYYTYALAYPDGKFFYIGKGKGYRIRTHRTEARRKDTDGQYTSNSYKCRIIRKLWASGEDYQQIFLARHATEQEAFLHEIALIFLSGDKLANLTNGGEGTAGRVLTEEHRQRISQSHQGKKFPHEGKPRSEACRQKIRVIQLGRTQSEETKHKRAEALKGYKASEETRRKLREAAIRQHQTKKGFIA